MSASGTVTVRFDVQGNEKLLQTLITTATGMDKMKSSATTLQSTLGGIGVGNLGPLNNMATSVQKAEAAMGTATTKVATFKEKLAGIGTQLGSNATSFGVATASIWGVYNAYDSLEKVQIRAHASAVKVQTLETSLAALTERRRLAVEKGNLSGEQMAILNEKIANTTEKLSVAQERNADVTQDVQEAWAGFFSTVGPQAIAATGSIIQLGTVFKSTFAGGGGFINTFKNAITGLFPSLAAAKAESLLLGRNIGNLGSSIGGTTGAIKTASSESSLLGKSIGGLSGATIPAAGAFGKLKTALGDVGSFLTSSKGLLLGMAGAMGIAAAAAVSLFHILSEGAKAKGLNEKIMAGTASMKDLQEQIKTLQGISADPFAQLEKWFFGGSIGKMIKPETTAGMSEELIKGIQAQIDVKEVGKTIQGMFDSMQPIPLGANIDFSQMSPKIQAGLQSQMAKIIAMINNPTNWKAKIDPNTGKEIFSQADVQHFTINALQPLLDGLQKSVASGQFDTYIQKATDGIQKKFFTAMMGGPKGGGAAALTGETGKFAQAALQKQFAPTGFEAGSATEAAAQKGAAIRLANNKALAAANKEYADRIALVTELLDNQASSSAELNAEDVQMITTFGGLNRATLTNADVRKKLLDISFKQQKGHEAEELSILDLAAANDVYSSQLANLAATEGDHVTQMNNILAASINYTSALTDQDKNQKLVSEGFRDGVIQAKGYFDGLVKGTEQEGAFRDAIADGAKTLGIKSNLLAFSTGKMQELIKTTYDQTQAYTAEALAASKSTAFLQDKVLIQGQVTAGMIEGRVAANDWAVSLDKSVAAEKANHTQLLQIAADMLQLPINTSLSSEALQTLMTRFTETKDAAGSLASVMREDLAPIFEPMKEFLTATNWKDFNSAFKSLDLKKLGIPKDLRDSLKDAGKDLLHINENALEAKTGLSALFTVAFTGRSKGIKSGIKEFLDDLKEIPTMGDLSPFISQMQAIMALPKEERAAAFKKMGPAILEMMKALAPDENGFVLITPEEIDKINAAMAETGPSAQGSVSGVNALNTSLGGLAKSLGDFASAQLDVGKSSPLTNFFLSQQIPSQIGEGKDKTTEITPPAPLVFPPPDMHNITDAIAKIEVDIGSMVDFAANLVLIFPAPNIEAINGGLVLAENNLASIIDYVANLVPVFPSPNIEAINSGLVTAENNLGSIIDFTAGLVVAFPAPNIEAINQGLVEAENNLGSIIDFMKGLKLVFQKPNTQPITAGASIANATIKTVETLIKGMKLPFNKPTYDQITSAVSAATKSMKSLEGIAKGLKLVFPKPDISQIEHQVDAAQKKINSLKPKNITNTITTHYETTGTKPKARGGIEYRESATNTTWGEAGPEIALFMPLTKAGQARKGDYDIRIPSPTIDSAGIRNMLRDNRGTTPVATSEGRGGPATVNVTTEVYLFPGSEMFKKFVKSIMLEEMSRYAAV